MSDSNMAHHRMGRKDADGPDDASFHRLPDAKQGEEHL